MQKNAKMYLHVWKIPEQINNSPCVPKPAVAFLSPRLGSTTCWSRLMTWKERRQTLLSGRLSTTVTEYVKGGGGVTIWAHFRCVKLFSWENTTELVCFSFSKELLAHLTSPPPQILREGRCKATQNRAGRINPLCISHCFWVAVHPTSALALFRVLTNTNPQATVSASFSSQAH